MSDEICVEPAGGSKAPRELPAAEVTVTTSCVGGPGVVGFLGSRLCRFLPH